MRIIPITIITAVLFIILKFVDITNSTKNFSGGALISSVEAQQPESKKEELMKNSKPEDKSSGAAESKPAEKTEGKATEKTDGKSAEKTDGKATEKTDGKPEAAKEGGGGDEGEAKGKGEGKEGEPEANPNVSYEAGQLTDRHFSESELDLLQKLGNRRRELSRWERNIQIKEEVLNATEKRINDQIAKIESMRKQVASLLAEYNEKEDAKIRSLVKIYENMKPKDAARIFDEVEMPVLLLVIDKMSEKKAAPILAQMNPRKAKQITVELAEKRRYDSAKLTGAAEMTKPAAK